MKNTNAKENGRMNINYRGLAEEILKSNESKQYPYIAFRSLTEDDKKEVGATLPPSYDHDFELDISTFETTKETLNGTSGTRIDFDFEVRYEKEEERITELIEALKESMKEHKNYIDYFGRVIIGGDNIEYGDDFGEIIIEDAEVLVVIY